MKRPLKHPRVRHGRLPGDRRGSAAPAYQPKRDGVPAVRPLGHQQKRDGAFVICLDRAQRVLFGRQTYGAKKLTLLGGGLERGEKFNLAALGEMSEEGGLFGTARNLKLVGLMIQRLQHEHHAAGTVAVYEFEMDRLVSRPADGELEDLQFVSIEDALARADEFLPTMLRVAWLAHARRNSPGAPNHFEGHMTDPIFARRRNGRFVCI